MTPLRRACFGLLLLSTACTQEKSETGNSRATGSNGFNWNGRAWNGRSWNGRAWNGRAWNGRAWNGRAWNGLTWDHAWDAIRWLPSDTRDGRGRWAGIDFQRVGWNGTTWQGLETLPTELAEYLQWFFEDPRGAVDELNYTTVCACNQDFSSSLAPLAAFIRDDSPADVLALKTSLETGLLMGGMGVARNVCQGSEDTEVTTEEVDRLYACFAAFTNPSFHVSISLRNSQIPSTPAEVAQYGFQEQAVVAKTLVRDAIPTATVRLGLEPVRSKGASTLSGNSLTGGDTRPPAPRSGDQPMALQDPEVEIIQLMLLCKGDGFARPDADPASGWVQQPLTRPCVKPRPADVSQTQIDGMPPVINEIANDGQCASPVFLLPGYCRDYGAKRRASDGSLYNLRIRPGQIRGFEALFDNGFLTDRNEEWVFDAVDSPDQHQVITVFDDSTRIAQSGNGCCEHNAGETRSTEPEACRGFDDPHNPLPPPVRAASAGLYAGDLTQQQQAQSQAHSSVLRLDEFGVYHGGGGNPVPYWDNPFIPGDQYCGEIQDPTNPDPTGYSGGGNSVLQ